jgi:hypothetical protein
MTSTYPAHPAGSFNYPHLARLPTLAVYSLTKVTLGMSSADSNLGCLQLREYTLQEQSDTSTPANTAQTRQDNLVSARQDNMQETSESNPNSKFRYDVIDKIKEQKNNIVEFVPAETIAEMKSHNETPFTDTPRKYRYKKKRVGLLGSKPSTGFRSSSSRTGYHASTSPENFFKKKYESKHLSKSQRKVFSGALEHVPKSELYQHIMAQYRKGGIKTKKKKLRRRKHRRHRSKLILEITFIFTACFFRTSELPGVCMECMGSM